MIVFFHKNLCSSVWFTHYTESQYDPFGVVTFQPNQYF
jgi:hypothetical protein